MIAQAGIAPGARVLEIGTTGYNAALIAEVAGPGCRRTPLM
jgi:protein-L-isoaspartate(D-aspartate) O-methyltransferase